MKAIWNGTVVAESDDTVAQNVRTLSPWLHEVWLACGAVMLVWPFTPVELVPWFASVIAPVTLDEFVSTLFELRNTSKVATGEPADG